MLVNAKRRHAGIDKRQYRGIDTRQQSATEGPLRLRRLLDLLLLVLAEEIGSLL